VLFSTDPGGKVSPKKGIKLQQQSDQEKPNSLPDVDIPLNSPAGEY